MWNPPIELSPEEQKIAKRTRKAWKFFVFLRTIRHQLRDTAFQTTLAQSYSPEPGGKAPVEAGLLALATLLQAYCNVGDREAVERTVMDKRWQMVWTASARSIHPLAKAPCSTFVCGSSSTIWIRPCWRGPWRWRRTQADSVPGSCGPPWTPRPCSAPVA